MTGINPDWLAIRIRTSAGELRASTSATHLVRSRPGFGWRLSPAPGSILASSRMADWDPEPDYFHHWIRDAAIALASVPHAIAADPGSRDFWRKAVTDHIRFSLKISDPDRHGPATNPRRASTRPSHLEYLRPDAELAALTGAIWLEEPRFAADGSPDLERWSRPQDDGPALRASVLMRLQESLPEAATEDADRLIDRDLAHVLSVAGRPAIGPWEEEPARRTTFTLIAEWDALDRAADRAQARGQSPDAYRDAADRVASLVDQAVDPTTGAIRESIEAPEGHLDSATVLAILHADRPSGPFALTAPRTLATVAALERTFADIYPINRGRDVPAIGRWADDVYFGGNPWYPNTLGFAELHYRIAALTGDEEALAKAEAWMSLIAEFVPNPKTTLPEQFDRETGAPTSCLALTWSAAAFLAATAARAKVVQTLAR
ncbi:oligosaccharide amylase (plasmid) [Paracoccaceae bacterium]|nr:oligosaccharide amylase [Paracoccaceae bacterium]